MKVLVVFHIYYHDQVDWFISKMGNIHGCEWDLVVSWNRPDSDTERKLRDFKSDVSFVECSNVGYDIWPFIKVVRQTSLSDYDFIIKLHTKSLRPKRVRLNGCSFRGYEWRDTLVDALLKDRERFSEVSGIFALCPEVGMVCSAKLFSAMGFREDKALLDAELERLGLHTGERSFCIGTMFAIRTCTLKPLQENELKEEMFVSENRTDSRGTPSHVYERVLSLLVPAAGYQTRLLGSEWAFELKSFFRKTVQPVLGRLFSIDRSGEDGVKYLTVLGLKFPLDDGLS